MDMTIEPISSYYNVYQYDEYEESSLLAGQTRKSFIDSFDTIDEAVIEYPNAKVMEFEVFVSNYLPSVPPSWFDPMDAGEEW